MFRFLPESASEHASSVDWVHDLITDLSVFFTVAIVGTMLYFAFRYRQRDGVDHETPRIEGSHFLEFVWTVVPTIICVFLAYYGITVYRDMRTVPRDAFSIDVTGWQWRWDFRYPNGKKTTNEAVIPVDKPVKFVLTSGDVLHSFFVPAMRVKSDAIKSRYTYVTFKPVKTGTFNIFCTEYCGKDHSGMLANLKVVSQAEYERWLEDKGPSLPPSELGAKVHREKCASCHDVQAGIRVVGPTWVKLYGANRKFADGSSATADENYIRESILDPNKHVVEGFPANIMQSFSGQLSDEEITGVIAFIRTLDGTKAVSSAPAKPAAAAADLSKLSPAERGKLWYADSRYNCNSCHSIDGSRIVGPSFKGIFGRTTELADGTTTSANEAYITESIKQPMAKTVKGFPPAMPALPVSDAEIGDIIEFMKTLK